MNGIEKLVQGKTFKKLLAKLYGIGASVVVIGALFKIEHLPGASIMLSLGLCTEAVLFFFSAFETNEEEKPKVYPDYIRMPGHETAVASLNESNENQSYEKTLGSSFDYSHGNGSVALAKFDAMLEKADITPEMLENLGLGMKKLGEAAENISAMHNITTASSNYIKTIKSADESLGKLAKAYEKSITKVTGETVFKYKGVTDSLSMIDEESKNYQRQMEALNKNINTLNTIYRLQNKEAVDYLKEMSESASEAKMYRRQMKELNETVSALNNYYGDLLASMKQKKH